MEILLKKLKIKKFKGLKHMELVLKKNCNIYGDNEKGKTTVFDEFTWVMFGKGSDNREEFIIKVLDKKGQAIEGGEYSVTALLSVNGLDEKLKNVLSEKWIKQKGQEMAILKENINEYYINDVQVKQEEYKERIDDWINEDVFKIITNPEYLDNMPWQKCSGILYDMADKKIDDDIAAGNDRLENLLREMGYKNLEMYQMEISGKKKMLNQELLQLSARMDKVHKGLPVKEDYNENKDYINILTEIKYLEDSDRKPVEIEVLRYKQYELINNASEMQTRLLGKNTAERVHRRLRELKSREAEIIRELELWKSGSGRYRS